MVPFLIILVGEFSIIIYNDEIDNPSEKEIIDDIFEEYKCNQKLLSSAPKKERDLFTDALTDIALHVGWQHIEFEDSTRRNDIIRNWAEEFVLQHANTDWNENDYFNLVDSFAANKIEAHLKENPRTQYSVKYVLGTDAVREYNNCVDDCVKWNDSSLCDCGGVAEGIFNTAEELAAYKEGIIDAVGYLEYERMMTDEEWQQHLVEYGNSEGDNDY